MSDEKEMAATEAATVLFFGIPIHTAFSAFVGWKLWVWGAVPAFNAPMIGYGYALVLSALVVWLRPLPSKTVGMGQGMSRIWSLMVSNSVLLLIGYIGHRMAMP